MQAEEEFQDLDTDNHKKLGKIKALAIYGDITGRQLEDGKPERLDWAAHYRGRMAVIYGHSIVDSVRWINNTVNIDTGCFKTGLLTAVRMPEREIVQNR
jgi:protein phosphatase